MNNVTTTVQDRNCGLTCLTGVVVLLPTPGIGATNAVLLLDDGSTIRLRQVPGPNNRGIPLAQADQRRVSVCGNFLFDGGQVILNVQLVTPARR